MFVSSPMRIRSISKSLKKLRYHWYINGQKHPVLLTALNENESYVLQERNY